MDKKSHGVELRMKAWRLYGARDFRLEKLPTRELKPGRVLVEVKVVQSSVTEVELIQGSGLLHWGKRMMRKRRKRGNWAFRKESRSIHLSG